MTRHGRPAGASAVQLAGRCGMPVGRDSGGHLVPCDLIKWHRGGCSTKAQRKAARA